LASGGIVRDIRDSPWFYPIALDIAVLLTAAVTLSLDRTQPTSVRVAAPAVFLVLNGVAIALILRRRRRDSPSPRHSGSR